MQSSSILPWYGPHPLRTEVEKAQLGNEYIPEASQELDTPHADKMLAIVYFTNHKLVSNGTYIETIRQMVHILRSAHVKWYIY